MSRNKYTSKKAMQNRASYRDRLKSKAYSLMRRYTAATLVILVDNSTGKAGEVVDLIKEMNPLTGVPFDGILQHTLKQINREEHEVPKMSVLLMKEFRHKINSYGLDPRKEHMVTVVLIPEIDMPGPPEGQLKKNRKRAKFKK